MLIAPAERCFPGRAGPGFTSMEMKKPRGTPGPVPALFARWRVALRPRGPAGIGDEGFLCCFGGILLLMVIIKNKAVSALKRRVFSFVLAT